MAFSFASRAHLLLIAIGLAMTLPLQAAQACVGDKVLYEERFQTPDPGWGRSVDIFKIGDGKAVLSAAPRGMVQQWNPGFLFDDADICYKVTLLQQTADPTFSASGFLFWTLDPDNFFLLMVASNGYFKIARQVAGQWVPDPIGWRTSDALLQGPKQTNAMRLTLRGETVSVEANGKPLISFRAQTPRRPTAIGLYAQSATSTDPWAFSEIKVTNVK